MRLHESGSVARRESVKKKDRWSKKTWYPVIAPAIFGGKKIGETAAVKPEQLLGRTISVPLSDLTGNLKHYHTKVFLKIVDVRNGEAKTEYAGQELLRDSLARLVRRWSSRIDSVDEVKTSDGKKIRIKSMAISLRRIDTSLKKKLRHSISEAVRSYADGKPLENIVQDMISGTLQKTVRKKVNPTYPLRAMEIRKTEVSL